MRELSYNEIVNIQNNIYRKLISYINDYLDKDNNIESIEFHYPDFNDDKTSKAFDSWLIMDYKTKYKKTFITHMLEDSSFKFSFLERKILEEIKDVYLSLYEIIRVKNDYIEVYDLLNNEKHKLLDQRSVNIVKKGDIVFGRIGKVLDFKVFLGNFSFLPPSAKNNFISKFFAYYNKMNLKKEYLSIKEYSKNNSLNLYKIYTELVYDLIRVDEDIASKLYDELDSFRDYMESFLSLDEIDECVGNLMNFFEFYLIENDLTLKDINKIDFALLAKKAIEENYINSKEDFSSYLRTFKSYLKFLKGKDIKYKLSYEEILDISKNRFIYFNLINQADNPFKINKKIANGIYKKFNEKSFSTLMDYERFLLNIMNDPLSLDKNNQILLEDLVELNSVMDNEIPLEIDINKSSFTMLELFYKFSLDIEVLEIYNGFLKITKKGNQFIRLRDEDRFSILFNYIWSKKFLVSIAKEYNFNEDESNLFLELLSSLKENEDNRLEKVIETFDSFPMIIDSHYKFLEVLGMVKYNDDENLKISITPFGKLVLDLNFKDNNIKDYGKIININRRKKIK